MSLRIEAITKKFKEINKVKELYYNSFPKEEQLPLWIMFQKSKKNFVDFLAFYDNDILIGFSYLISNNDLTYVFYLAIDPNIRSHGYGGKVLMKIKEKYPSNRLVLSIEPVDETANNYEQRVKREKFYLNNGYRYLNYGVAQNGQSYDILVNGKYVSMEEFSNLFKKFIGNLLFLLFKPKLISSNSKSSI